MQLPQVALAGAGGAGAQATGLLDHGNRKTGVLQQVVCDAKSDDAGTDDDDVGALQSRARARGHSRGTIPDGRAERRPG